MKKLKLNDIVHVDSDNRSLGKLAVIIQTGSMYKCIVEGGEVKEYSRSDLRKYSKDNTTKGNIIRGLLLKGYKFERGEDSSIILPVVK